MALNLLKVVVKKRLSQRVKFFESASDSSLADEVVLNVKVKEEILNLRLLGMKLSHLNNKLNNLGHQSSMLRCIGPTLNQKVLRETIGTGIILNLINLVVILL